MTDAILPADRFVERDFRVGRLFNRTSSILSRNFLIFFTVSVIAAVPTLVFMRGPGGAPDPTRNLGLFFGGLLLSMVLSALSQAIVLYGAFQDMRGRPVSLIESLQVGLRRFFPIIGLALLASVLAMLASLLLVVPGLILFTMWFVATPACVVEQLGPVRSLGRSRALTKGHRWKIFGLMLLLFIPAGIVGNVVDLSLAALGGGIPLAIGHLIWSGIWGAFFAIFVVVTYHDLRVAKEGVDTDQIAAVFE